MGNDRNFRLAKRSWQMPLGLLVCMMIVTPMMNSSVSSLIMGAVYLIVFLVGLVSAILAIVRRNSEHRRKVLIHGLAGLVLNLGIPVLMVNIGISSYQRARESAINTMLQAQAMELSEKVPLQIDAYTWLDAVEFSASRTLKFSFSLLAVSQEDVNVDEFTLAMRERLITEYPTLPEAETYRRFSVNMIYAYYDKNGLPVGSVLIECDKMPPVGQDSIN